MSEQHVARVERPHEHRPERLFGLRTFEQCGQPVGQRVVGTRRRRAGVSRTGWAGGGAGADQEAEQDRNG